MPLEERISHVLTRHSVQLVQFEVSEHFGNSLLVVSAPPILLRFVRDRGYNSCEICKRNHALHWEDDRLASEPPFSHISDFCDFVDAVLSARHL